MCEFAHWCAKKKTGSQQLFFSKKYTCYCILRNKYMSSSQSKTRIRSNWVRLSWQVKFVNWKHSFLNLRNAVLGGWMYSKINRNNKCPWIFFRYRRVGFKYPLVKSDFQKVIFSDFQNAPYNPIKKNALNTPSWSKSDFFTRVRGVFKTNSTILIFSV